MTKALHAVSMLALASFSGAALGQVAVPREPMQITPLPPGTITVDQTKKPAKDATAAKDKAPAKDGTAAIHDDGELVLTKSFCMNLVAYAPAPDVAYKPGVDVNGKAVAPADLPGQTSYPLSSPVQSAIILDTSRLGQIGALPGRGDTYPVLISVDPRTGDVALNGQKIQQSDESTLAKLCRERGLSR
jgi:hypothetical protein